MNLQLSLKKKWFEMTKAGIKTEEYREITPYWMCRLLYESGGIRKDRHYWAYKSDILKGTNDEIKENILLFYSHPVFESTVLTLGYPKSDDKEKILTLENKGIEVDYGNTEWGAEPNKLYFVIKHGSRN